MNLTENTRRLIFVLMPTSARCAGIDQHRLMYTNNRRNLFASDPDAGPIWCRPSKKPSRQELVERKREISRRLASLQAIVEFPFRVV